MNYNVGEIQNYGSPLPHYEPPVKIGHFSTDSENRFCDNDHQLKYLSMPEKLTDLHLDLNKGYSSYVHDYNDEEPPYNKQLRWIVSHKEEVKGLLKHKDSSKREIDFICHRSVLIKISSTLYDSDRNDDWCIYATKFQSVIYLCNDESNLQQKEPMSERNRRMCSWGYKFEQYITSDSINSKPNTSHPVNINEKFFVLMKGKLENHGILFSGETDAVDPHRLVDSESDSMNRFVEIKTTRLYKNEKMSATFRRKLQKLYVQSFLAGIPRIICGFRDEEGIVREIKVFRVSDLPEMAKGLWSKDVCLNFLSRFLNFLKEFVVKDDPKVVYKFYWKHGESKIICEELSPDKEYQFLPSWYTEKILAL